MQPPPCCLRSTLVLLPMVAALQAAPAAAEDPPATAEPAASSGWRDTVSSLLDNDYYKVSLDVRARLGLADIDGNRNSYATTVRTRFGIGSKPLYGFSTFVEGEGTFSFDDDKYYNGLGDNSRNRSVVADPEAIQLNRAFGRYQNAEFFGTDIIGGRQRIILDDARFVGNVGWRQNEQTYDAAWGSTSFGLDGLRFAYAFLWRINRIYSDQGASAPPSRTEDYDSRSHFAHATWTRYPWLKASLFGYFLDFEGDSPSDSSSSYGFRVWGEQAFDEVWKVGYSGSFAYQTDNADNPADYDAYYGWVEGSFGHEDFATVGTGYEHLGSDEGVARFVTPLATAHKFNGFADAFLDNGGVTGLQDYFVWLSPSLPFGFEGKVVYHRFWSARGGTYLGDEWDFLVTRRFWQRFLILAKGAFFDGSSNNGPADRWRFTLELNFKY